MAESVLPSRTSPSRPGLFARFRARLRPPRRLRITREGWVFVLVCIGVGGAAINTGNNLLFLVLGLMLSLIVVSGVMSESTLRRVMVTRHLPSRVFAKSPTLVEVTLHNRKSRLPSYSIELEDQILGWSTDKRCYFLKVGPLGKQTAAYRTVIPERGPLSFTGYRVATRFPFALFEKWREIDLPDQVVVFPAIVPVPRAVAGQQRQFGERTRRRPGQGEEIHGLRELRSGDDYRAIHWRTSARRGQLMVRENEEESARELCIYLDNARSASSVEGGRDPVVEKAISIASSLAIERSSAGQGVSLAVRGDVGPSVQRGGSPDRLLRFLALLDYAPAEDPPPLGRLPSGESVLIAESSRATGFDGALIVVEPDGDRG